MTTRRNMLAALVLGSLAMPLRVLAKQSNRSYRVGFLYVRSRPTTSSPDPYLDAFVQKMRELGYVEGKNLVIEWRFADGQIERLPGFALELARMKVDVIVTHSILTTQAAQRATRTIPIVFAAITDPVVSGVVNSLARPAGNTTGLSLMSVDMSPKQVELLASIIPKLSRIAVLMNPTAASHPAILKTTQATAQLIGATVLSVEARNPDEIERGFVTLAGWRAEAVIVPNDPILIGQRRQIVQLALKNRIPAMFAYREAVEAGGLLSYGQDLSDYYRRAAGYVDKIFKGAKTSDLPIEQPTNFEFAVNLKTARALGVKIPQSVLLRADKVIE